TLTKEEQRLFGQAALTYRYEDENKSPVSIEQIIHPRRYEDKKYDIWTTYQRVQENLIKEGANKQVISSQADSLIKISRIWADFFPANTSNQPI
ncbi:hypothetical protein AB6191_28480, partial [Klebsiella pneumoniae]